MSNNSTYQRQNQIDVIDLRSDDLQLEKRRWKVLNDSLNQTAIRMKRQRVILENVEHKYFPYVLLPRYRSMYQNLVLIIRTKNLLTLYAMRKEYHIGEVTL